MEARFARAISAVAFSISLCSAFGHSSAAFAAAGYKTTNFVVSAPTPELAKEIGDQAEMWRKQLSIEWLGQEMRPWSKPCPISAQVAPNLGAGGQTSFVFDRGEVFGWNMSIQGTRERVLDSVLPHEVTHTIFASYFRQPLPRWADEGACTTVEHRSEVAKQERMLIQFLKSGRGIRFDDLFAMKKYPADVMPLYAEGHSVAQWLIESRGRKAFLTFLSDGLTDEDWSRAVKKHYGFNNLFAMQGSWNEWVRQGRPELNPQTSPITLALAKASAPMTLASTTAPAVRTQSPDDITPINDSRPERGHSKTAVTVASLGGSVYSDAARSGKPLPNMAAANTASSTSAAGAVGRSVYSRYSPNGSSTMLR